MFRDAVPGPRPGGPYSPGIVAEGRFVFVSGQGPVRDGVYVQGTIEEETRLTLDNLLAVLAASGSGPENVVRCGVWLTDLADFAAMNGVYADVFPDRSQRERPSKHSSASGASRSTALRWFQAIRH